jgi:Ca2+-binding EF-hand superfamily protein
MFARTIVGTSLALTALVSPAVAQTKVGGLPVKEVILRLGAKLETALTAMRLRGYERQFSATDTNKDGKHSVAEYVENGRYLNARARRGIFRAADVNRDGSVSEAEYILNRIITDEAKSIVQAMDRNRDGVDRTEFLQHGKIRDEKLATAVFAALDGDGDGRLAVPEYLRVWGRWARIGRAPAEDRVATARARIKSSLKSRRRIKSLLDTLDRDGDGKLSKEEIANAARSLKSMDQDGNGEISAAELRGEKPRPVPKRK